MDVFRAVSFFVRCQRNLSFRSSSQKTFRILRTWNEKKPSRDPFQILFENISLTKEQHIESLSASLCCLLYSDLTLHRAGEREKERENPSGKVIISSWSLRFYPGFHLIWRMFQSWELKVTGSSCCFLLTLKKNRFNFIYLSNSLR